MNNTRTYKVEMSATGRITQLPDSQRIFGALIYMYSDQYSQEMTTALVSKIKEKQFYFALSNLFPLDYLPLPQSFISDLLSDENRKQYYREIKKRSYVTLENIEEALMNPKAAADLYPYATVRSTQQIHASIDSIRLDLPGLDPNVYSVPEVNVIEVQHDRMPESDADVITQFSFYIRMDHCEEGDQLLEALRLAQEKRKRFILGARASQGMNTYVIRNIHAEPWEIRRISRSYLNLGMLLPGAIDLEKSSLKLFPSERRPYRMEEGMTRIFINFIDAGSIVYLDDPEEAGRSITSLAGPPEIIFGNALLLPMPIHDGKEVSKL